MSVSIMSEGISLSHDEVAGNEEKTETIASVPTASETDGQPLIGGVTSLEPEPSTSDNQQREVKWGAPTVALNEIEIGSALPPRREHDRWWSSTAFKSGIAMLAVVGIIAIVVGVAATQAKEDSLKSAKQTNLGGEAVYNARAMSLFCDSDPPANDKCVKSDWNSQTRTEGTRVFYRCISTPSKNIVRTVECDGFTWVDKFNRLNDCPCENEPK